MKNYCIRISKTAAPMIALATLAFNSNGQGTLTLNGTQCTAPWSISASTSGTVVNVPAACLGTPLVCAANGAPTITSFTPTTGNATTLITVTGTNLCNATSVTVNGTAATGVTTSTGSSLTAVIGAGTTTGPVAVTTSGGSATSTANFTVATLVTLTAASPNPVLQGGTLTVTGTNFVPSAVTVNVGTTPIVATNASTTSATVTIPASIANGSYQVTVSTNSQVSSAVQLTVGSIVNGCGSPGVDCSIEQDVIPSPSRAAPSTTTPERPGKANGSSDPSYPMNSYSAERVAQKCANATPAVSTLWQHNINLDSYRENGGFDYPFLGRGEAMTWKFVAQTVVPTAGLMVLSGSSQIPYAPAFITVSEQPCDFDVTKANINACYKSGRAQLSIYYQVTSQLVPAYQCQLTPGKTYYLNLRMQTTSPAAESCASPPCGGNVKIQ